jgi:hypothetical protein
MKKRREIALLNSIEAAGAQVLHDTTSAEWSIVTLSTNKELLLGPFRYGKGVRVEYFDPVAEVRQLVIIGASATKETIVASTRYRIEIGAAENRYESDRAQPGIFAYTSSSTLSGTAATDRAVVYRALRDKINRYAGANCTAYTLTQITFTGGGSVGDTSTTFIVGEAVDQATSLCTAKVAKCTFTGTFANDDAAGTLWLYNVSDETAWLNTDIHIHATANTYVAGVSSNCIVTQDGSENVHAVGLAILDTAGYFTSNFDRGGKNYVGLTQGFATDTPVIAITAEYAMGIGNDMISQAPVWDLDKVDIIRGNPEYVFNQGNAPVAGYTYQKIVIVTADGDEDSLGGTREKSERESILYLYYSDSDLADFKTHLDLAIAY